ncbi:MAG TPA: NAD-dependent epimerase/dehydratase family protein [Dermatophilaceae bacterium]|nr:NAD-dependent epimerase/dehydratase family protein [Dermatophilaceae bacterium]
MSILVLGGTAWLGGHVARAGLAAGHDVTCLARGESGSVPDGARLVLGDRTTSEGYAGLSPTQEWDLVVDVSRQPGQVRTALEALSSRTRSWVFVSSGSVYADHSKPGDDESAELLPALVGDVGSEAEYGQAKVACEALVTSARDGRALVARCGLIAGAGDVSDRLGYWPGRFALAARDHGPVLVPERDDRPSQFVHVEDLAVWLVRAGLAGTTGILDAYGPVQPIREVLEVSKRLAGFTGETVPFSDERLQAAGVEEYMGPRSLPLWIADPQWQGFSARSSERARAAGLTTRPIEDTLRDALDWERELGVDRTDRRAGLTRADELALIDAV